jgi:hypothetical protein
MRYVVLQQLAENELSSRLLRSIQQPRVVMYATASGYWGASLIAL